MTERDKLEEIDAHVGHIAGQFRRVENLLSALFERQVELEELVREQQSYLQICAEKLGKDHPMVEQINALQQHVNGILAQSVK